MSSSLFVDGKSSRLDETPVKADFIQFNDVAARRDAPPPRP
jgi:hypothetical protein